MSTKTQFRSDVFNQIFNNQFGYEPIMVEGISKSYYNPTKKVVKLLKDEDATYKNLGKLQIMGYIPYVVELLENPTKYPKPSFREILRMRGVKVTSCSSIRTIFKRMGLIDYVGGKMVKGKNYDKILTTNWDWFYVCGTKVFIKGNEYSVGELRWFNNQIGELSMMDEIDYDNQLSDSFYEIEESIDIWKTKVIF